MTTFHPDDVRVGDVFSFRIVRIASKHERLQKGERFLTHQGLVWSKDWESLPDKTEWPWVVVECIGITERAPDQIETETTNSVQHIEVQS